MYTGFSMRSQQRDKSSSNLTGGGSSNRPTSAGAIRSNRNQQFSHGQNNNNSSSHGGGRNITGTTNMFSNQHNQAVNAQNLHNNANGLLLGQGYTQQQQQRPSSAGHSRGAAANAASHLNAQNPNILSHLLGTQQYPNIPTQGAPVTHNILPTGGLVNGSGGGGGGSSRPKSAGSVRRSNHDQQQAHLTQQNLMTMQNIYGGGAANVASNVPMTAQQMYNMQQQQQQAHQQMQYKQQQQHIAEQQALHAQQQQQQQTYQYHAPATTTQRPLSANATSHTSAHLNATNNAAQGGGYVDHWSNQYKMHYAYNAQGQPVPQQQQQQSGVNKPPTTANSVQYASSSNAQNGVVNTSNSAIASKLRTAVDLSHKYENAPLNGAAAPVTAITGGVSAQGVPMVQLAGLDNGDDDDGDLGLDGLNMNAATGGKGAPSNRIPLRDEAMNTDKGAGVSGQAENEDEEMDGKPIDVSRSHPEVSLTTPSASLELGNQSSVGLNNLIAVDVRNTSLDSFSEDHIVVGLSTVPNQFCTKRDALELKKLLVLSAGTRGGIVPSSSAVMDMYMVGKVVGVGSYGKVRAAWHRLTSSKVAIKTYDKSKMKDPAHWKRVHSEIKIMEQVSHPRIARMYEAVETPKRMHLIMECLDGGNLCSYVKAKRRLSEDESRRIFFQILQAIEHLHAHGVSHRDVKLENVLFENDKDIKLIDFGFSTICQPGKKLKVFCGTPSYMAPEIVRRAEYEGKPVDIWSLGILLYALLCGCFPFRAKAYPDLYRRIARGTFPIPDELSAPVKDLLRQLLTVDPEARITAHAAMRHSWLQVQLINAPNIDKLRQETTILISDKPADDLDDQVISELEKFGMARDEVIRLVLTKTHSSLATLYYLLLDTLVSKRRVTNKRNGIITGGPSHHGVVHLHSSGHTGSQPQRPKSASATGSSSNNTALHMANAIGTAGQPIKISQYQQQAPIMSIQQQQAAAQHQAELQQQLQQQQYGAADAQQTAAQQQQVNDRQEYRYRPKSAAMNRANSTGTQRPNSAFATRR